MKLLLVIDVADDAAENYKDFTVDYDLRGTPIDDEKVNESIEYVEDCPLRPLPCKKYMRQMPSDVLEMGKRKRDIIIHRVDVDNAYATGWNDCLEAITGEKE